MDIESAKLLGAGIAVLGVIGSGIGIGSEIRARMRIRMRTRTIRVSITAKRN